MKRRIYGALGETRTPMPGWAADFESAASTSSATRANQCDYPSKSWPIVKDLFD